MPEYRIKIKKEKFLPCYWHLLNNTQLFDIDFLYGGRDSGKSRHIAMQLIIDCMREDYFKCLLIRKVLNTVRSSQYDLIKSIIAEWKLSHLFSFNETRLEIICRLNGNGFYGRGLDDVGRIKSFNNPSHSWIEEGNQISNEDFVVILTSLRANRKVKTWFSFNPECEESYTEFWLWQDWFSHSADLSWEWTKTIITPRGPVDISARATHSTYLDNPFCTPQRQALYESYKTSKNNAYWYQTYTLGLWGYRRTGGEFWKCFEEAKHTAATEWIQNETAHIVLDNNVNPYVTVAIWQIFEKEFVQQHEIPCSTPDNNAPKAARKTARWLRSISYQNPVYLYGDPSANAKSTVDENNKSFFDKFTEELEKEGFKVINRVAKSAPEVALSGAFINEIYETNYQGYSITINTKCRVSIEDYTMAKEDDTGKILKKRKTDPETKISYEKYGHYSDAKRYFIVRVLEPVFNQYKARFKKPSITTVKK